MCEACRDIIIDSNDPNYEPVKPDPTIEIEIVKIERRSVNDYAQFDIELKNICDKPIPQATAYFLALDHEGKVVGTCKAVLDFFMPGKIWKAQVGVDLNIQTLEYVGIHYVLLPNRWIPAE